LVLAAKWQTLVADFLVAGLALQVSSAQYNKGFRVEHVTGAQVQSEWATAVARA
jgi:hypothetical protein